MKLTPFECKKKASDEDIQAAREYYKNFKKNQTLLTVASGEQPVQSVVPDNEIKSEPIKLDETVQSKTEKELIQQTSSRLTAQNSQGLQNFSDNLDDWSRNINFDARIVSTPLCTEQTMQMEPLEQAFNDNEKQASNEISPSINDTATNCSNIDETPSNMPETNDTSTESSALGPGSKDEDNKQDKSPSHEENTSSFLSNAFSQKVSIYQPYKRIVKLLCVLEIIFLIEVLAFLIIKKSQWYNFVALLLAPYLVRFCVQNVWWALSARSLRQLKHTGQWPIVQNAGEHQQRQQANQATASQMRLWANEWLAHEWFDKLTKTPMPAASEGGENKYVALLFTGLARLQSGLARCTKKIKQSSQQWRANSRGAWDLMYLQYRRGFGSMAHWFEPEDKLMILCIPGFMADGSCFDQLQKSLSANQWSTVIFSGMYQNETIDQGSERVVQWIDKFEKNYGKKQWILLGHSMGGLVARKVAQNKHVLGILTLGTPHWGTCSAELSKAPAAKQMRFKSDWIMQLNQSKGDFVPLYALASTSDLIITPPTSAVYDSFEYEPSVDKSLSVCIQQGDELTSAWFTGISHVGLLYDKRIHQCVIDKINQWIG